MYKDKIKKAAKYFNENKMDKLAALWTDDVKIYYLKTNELIIDGKEQFIRQNKPYMNKGKIKFVVKNIVEVDNMLLCYFSFKGFPEERVAIYEVKDGLFHQSWIARFDVHED